MNSTLGIVDWCIIGGFLLLIVGIGLYYTRRASDNIQSFFISGQSLTWYISGVSMIATSFASDTPLWITSLVRQYGLHYAWQYWAQAIGASLGVVLFARLIRRTGLTTDVEMIELRYSGRWASALRFYSGFSGALFMCPLIISWVTKAMVMITREAMGLSPEYQIWATALVVVVAVVACCFSGLWGVVYTDFIQFFIATGGTLLLAILAVKHVGGLDAMVQKLSSMESWVGHNLNITPSIGPEPHQMSLWNAIGYFVILWWGPAACGAYVAQRLLACKNVRHASDAMLLNTIVYYGLIAWPWIVVALCSMIMFPTLTNGMTHDSAYPRMIVTLMPPGLRGLLVAAMLAAFISTVSTLVNWGSSYLVNDVYKRFLHPRAGAHHYVWISRMATVLLAVLGGLISIWADSLQQLLSIFYVTSAGMAILGILRWFWWRLNAAGELAGTLASWIIAPLLLFGKICDAPMRAIFNIQTNFSDDPNLLGARMFVVLVVVVIVSVLASLATQPTNAAQLVAFVSRVRPFSFFWRPVIRGMSTPYQPAETLGHTFFSWLLVMACVFSVLVGIGKVLLGQPRLGWVLIGLFVVLLFWIIRRTQRDAKS